MRCPNCNKTVEFTGNPFRPFCSERCKTIDLGKWAGEVFRIPQREFEDEDESSDVPADDIEGSSEN
jgi:endogenous inhibitor of DNA gyrase (YacG/DUF329 family)